MSSAATRSRPRRLLGLPVPTRRQRMIFWAVMVVVALLVNVWILGRATAVHRTRVPFSPFFLVQVRSGNVAEITSQGTAIEGRLRRPVRVDPGRGSRVGRFATEVPAFADERQLAQLLQNKGVVVNAQPLGGGLVWWKSIIFGLGPTALLLFLLYWLFGRLGRTAGLGGFSRARAKRFVPSPHATTFDDVAGIDEAKLELAEIVDFLRNPDKYQRLGGRIPRGVLLSGPPGTGKTLLARAVAGEAGVPFFAMSASEFVEAVVGIGASRVRDLFRQAKEAAPAIVFIDELDAIGRSRSGRSGVGSEEREQTLNQILTEMDGFDPTTSVIVIAATNRPDVLDQALLRPGRFDRRFTVQHPDRRGRGLILGVHAAGVPLAPDVDLDAVAARTSGMAGADLANLVNEAALVAARRGHDAVTADDLSDALERIILGAERGIVLSELDRRRTAYHEAGHALAAMLTPGTDPVRKVSIIPRGVALGVTYYQSESDRWNYTPTELTAILKALLGGQAAERIVFGESTTGLESDLERITQIARRMVGRWGMSERVGFVSVLADADRLDGDSTSEATRAIFDDEVRVLIEQANDEVLELLERERSRLDLLASALLDQETLDGDDIYRLLGLDPPTVPPAEQHALELT